MEQQVQKSEPRQELKGSDVGTRYNHLLEYRNALEECLEILKTRTATQQNQQRYVKLLIAVEVATKTLDAYSGYGQDKTEYSLYKLLKTVPATKEALIELGGTPIE